MKNLKEINGMKNAKNTWKCLNFTFSYGENVFKDFLFKGSQSGTPASSNNCPMEEGTVFYFTIVCFSWWKRLILQIYFETRWTCLF